MTRIFLHPEANTEVVSTAIYYEEQQADLDKRFIASIEDSLARIRINPLLFPLIDGDVTGSARRASFRTEFCFVALVGTLK